MGALDRHMLKSMAEEDILVTQRFSWGKTYSANQICEMVHVDFFIHNIFVKFAGHLFRQVIGIPVGINCANILADLFLYSYESDFPNNVIRTGQRKFARSFNVCFQYINYLLVFNNNKFWKYVKDMCLSQLNVEKANQSRNLASYLDLTFTIEKDGKLSTQLFDNHEEFDFHIVNFPFLSSNIPSGPSYGVFISQLIRYARCCSYYDDFKHRDNMLVERFVSQGYRYERLRNLFKRFYGRYQDLIVKYQRSVSDIVRDSFASDT